MTRLARAGAGRSAQLAMLAWERDWQIGLLVVGVLCLPVGVVLDDSGLPWVGVPLAVFGVVLLVAVLVGWWLVRTRSFWPRSLPYNLAPVARGSRSGDYDVCEPREVRRWRRSIVDPVLASQAELLWQPYLRALEAYTISRDAVHAQQAVDRAVLIRELARRQRQVNAARALVQAGGGVADHDDLERARHFLAELDRLEG